MSDPTVHADDEGRFDDTLTSCCGLLINRLPPNDRLTSAPERVTCPGAKP